MNRLVIMNVKSKILRRVCIKGFIFYGSKLEVIMLLMMTMNTNRSFSGFPGEVEDSEWKSMLQLWHVSYSKQRAYTLPCQHNKGYISCRWQIKVHTDERTQVYSARSSLVVTHPSTNRAWRYLTSVTEQALVATGDLSTESGIHYRISSLYSFLPHDKHKTNFIIS